MPDLELTKELIKNFKFADTQKIKLKAYEKLLNDFKALHIKGIDIEQTFMQLSGYSHYENVYSNLLAFFFDTEEAQLRKIQTDRR